MSISIITLLKNTWILSYLCHVYALFSFYKHGKYLNISILITIIYIMFIICKVSNFHRTGNPITL